MKQSIPPAAIVAAIVVVLAIAAFIGFKVLTPTHDSGPTQTDIQHKMAEHPGGYNPNTAGHGQMGSPTTGSPGSGGSPRPGSYPSSGGSPR